MSLGAISLVILVIQHFCTQLTKEISKPIGILWLTVALSLLIVTALFLLKKDGWSVLALIAAIFSQVLIFTVWQDAKFGTIPNLIIITTAVFQLSKYQLR